MAEEQFWFVNCGALLIFGRTIWPLLSWTAFAAGQHLKESRALKSNLRVAEGVWGAKPPRVRVRVSDSFLVQTIIVIFTENECGGEISFGRVLMVDYFRGSVSLQKNMRLHRVYH